MNVAQITIHDTQESQNVTSNRNAVTLKISDAYNLKSLTEINSRQNSGTSDTEHPNRRKGLTPKWTLQGPRKY